MCGHEFNMTNCQFNSATATHTTQDHMLPVEVHDCYYDYDSDNDSDYFRAVGIVLELVLICNRTISEDEAEVEMWL